MFIEDLIIGWLALAAAKILREWDNPQNGDDGPGDPESNVEDKER
jgi:hypothetical protein